MFFLLPVLYFFLPFVVAADQRAIISEDADARDTMNNLADTKPNLNNPNELKNILKLVNILSKKDSEKDNVENSNSNIRILRMFDKNKRVEVDSNVDDRRFWFSDLLKSPKVYMVPKTDKPGVETTAVTTNDNKKFWGLIPKAHANQVNLDKLEETQLKLVNVLQNLTMVLEKLNLNIQVENNLKTLKSLRINLVNDSSSVVRNKRDIGVDEDNSSLTSASQIADDIIEITTKPISTENINNTRRNEVSSDENDPMVTARLRMHIDNLFKEIKLIIKPVQNIKQNFADIEVFKIGYIVANLDTLEVNIRNLEHDIENNKVKWKSNDILEIFDKLLLANKVVANLVETVKEFDFKYKAANNL